MIDFLSNEIKKLKVEEQKQEVKDDLKVLGFVIGQIEAYSSVLDKLLKQKQLKLQQQLEDQGICDDEGEWGPWF